MSERENLKLAALASSAMPNIAVAAVRPSEQDNDTDRHAGIEQAVVQDNRGNLYNVYAADTAQGKVRLEARAKAASVIRNAHELAGLGFRGDHVLAFIHGPQDSKRPTVLVTAHRDGASRPLEKLTLEDCSSVGTAIGAIHRLQPNFIVEAHYPVHTTGQIRAQLTAWIKRLRHTGHIPPQITASWERIIETEGLWSFSTCPVHGGFSEGDIIFAGSSITTVTNWQEMQINDPARDLAWVFTKLDENHRNALVSAYGRILGNRLDDLIMLRANLWVQMSQVGDFIQALNKGDNAQILQFKTQVDRLAHQLGLTMKRSSTTGTAPAANASRNTEGAPSTVTVNTLLQAERDRRAQQDSDSSGSPSATRIGEPPTGYVSDTTDERPVVAATGTSWSGAVGDTSANAAAGTSAGTGTFTGTGTSATVTVSAVSNPEDENDLDRTSSRSIDAIDITENEELASSSGQSGTSGTFGTSNTAQSSSGNIPVNSMPQSAVQTIIFPDRSEEAEEQADSSAENASPETSGNVTIPTGARSYSEVMEQAKSQVVGDADNDDTGDSKVSSNPDAQTVLIPLLEREERAMRDARAGLQDSADSADGTDSVYETGNANADSTEERAVSPSNSAEDDATGERLGQQ